MLLQDYQCYSAADSYLNFFSTLQWYGMYCLARFGASKADYRKGFDELKRWCHDDLFARYVGEEFPDRVTGRVAHLLDSIEAILKSRRLTDEHIGQIGTLLWDFINKEEVSFRNEYFEYCIERDSQEEYSKSLYNAVSSLLDENRYDTAVLAAFRHLENHIQTTLGLSPHEYYGENLINYAFSPNSGVLQLGTGPSEQIGLRNFLSGAYAFFRNPSAHRSVKYDDFEAQTIIAMVAVMTRIVTGLHENSKGKDHEQSEESD